MSIMNVDKQEMQPFSAEWTIRPLSKKKIDNVSKRRLELFYYWLDQHVPSYLTPMDEQFKNSFIQGLKETDACYYNSYKAQSFSVHKDVTRYQGYIFEVDGWNEKMSVQYTIMEFKIYKDITLKPTHI